jgi:hypothetical protein
MIDPAIREDPFPYYDELRAQGHVVTSGFALMSAHHEVSVAHCAARTSARCA